MKTLMSGADPELMVFDCQEGRIASSLRIFPEHNKDNPIDLGDGIRLYPDNVLLETAFPPANSIADMMILLRTVLARIQETLGARYVLLAQAAHVFDTIELEHKKAWEGGCDPSKNAYTEDYNPKVKFTDGLRSGSFHLHIGYPRRLGFSEKVMMIRLMDIFVGCPSVIFDKDITGTLRRRLYGQAGEFRTTSYGAEYRVLGNYPLRSMELTELVWDLAHYAIEQFAEGNGREILEAVGSKRVIEAINTNNPELARDVMGIVGMPSKIMQRIEKDYGEPNLYESWGI